MPRLLKVALLGVLLLPLSACMVTEVGSKVPLFQTADAGAAPRPRLGVWLYEDADCRVDGHRAVKAWPGCASGFVVYGNEILGFGGSPQSQVGQTYVLAPGKPTVIQLHSRSPRDGEIDYRFGGVEALKRDASGQVVAIRQWGAVCGPPNPEAKTSAAPVPITRQSLPGLHMLADQDGCVADDAEAVRRAVALGRTTSDMIALAHWVRDSRPDDLGG